MIERYSKIEEFTRGIPELDQYVPTPVTRRMILAALDDLKRLGSISISLQKNGILLSDVEFIFDKVCKKYMTMRHYLFADADIVSRMSFEKAAIQIVGGRENDLEGDESNSVQVLRLGVIESNGSGTRTPSIFYFQQSQSKRRRLSEAKTPYMDVNFILTTFCTVKRLFTAAR